MPTSTRLIALTLAAALLAPERVQAQRRKLNGPLATGYLSDVTAFELASGRIVYTENETDLLTVQLNGGAPVQPIFQQTIGFDLTARLTPDGTRVVLHGDLETVDVSELFSLPADGSGPLVKLNAPLATDRYVYSYAISPDGELVVYTLATGFGLSGPYSVRTDGSQPAVALNDPNFVGDYQITADSAHVLFLSNSRLYTVPIEGGVERLRIHPALGGQRNGVPEFELAPDGSRVVYRLDFDQPEVYELYSAPVDGSALHVKLNGPLDPGSGVTRFQVSPFSMHVSYVAVQEGDDALALYGVPIAGGPIHQFSPGVNGRQIVEQRVTPDRARMLYVANHGASSSRYDLYSVPVDGSAPAVNLSASLDATDLLSGFLTDPVSGRVVFRAAENGVVGIFSAEPDGATPPVALAPAGALQVPSGAFAIAAGARAVFLADASLYSAPLDGSAAATRLHPPLVAGGGVFSFVLDAAGERALYRAAQDFVGVSELFVVPVDGSAPPAVRSSIREHLSTIGDVVAFELAPDGATAVFYANQTSGNGLYAVNLEGSPERVWLGAVGSFEITPDSQRVVFNSVIGLASLPIDASTGPTPISNLGLLTDWQISPDSNRVVHVHLDNGSSVPEQLFSTPLLGGSSVELNTPRILSGEVFVPQVSPDSSRLVYAGVQETAGVIELYSAPLAGSAAPVKLNAPLVTGGDVQASGFFEHPRISADSSRVVYLADQDVNNEIELFSVPLAGGVPPTELSALPASDRDVTSHATSPDSTRVVYVADQDANDVFELYSVPLAGGAAPTELSALPGTDRDVDSDPFSDYYSPFLIGPDSSRVVYLADQDANDVFELYSVPLAGGAAPVRLSFDATTASVTYLRAITAAGRVFYERETTGGVELYSAPIGGGSPPVRLNGSFAVTGSSLVPIDSGGRWVTFQAAPHQAGVNELFVVPIHGGSPPVRVNAPLVGGYPADVSGLFTAGGSSIVYLAEEDEAGVRELYVNELLNPRPDHRRPR